MRSMITLIAAVAAYALLTVGIVLVFDQDETAADYQPSVQQCEEVALH